MRFWKIIFVLKLDFKTIKNLQKFNKIIRFSKNNFTCWLNFNKKDVLTNFNTKKFSNFSSSFFKELDKNS